jgi:uncharacterized membrane protein
MQKMKLGKWSAFCLGLITPLLIPVATHAQTQLLLSDGPIVGTGKITEEFLFAVIVWLLYIGLILAVLSFVVSVIGIFVLRHKLQPHKAEAQSAVQLLKQFKSPLNGTAKILRWVGLLVILGMNAYTHGYMNSNICSPKDYWLGWYIVFFVSIIVYLVGVSLQYFHYQKQKQFIKQNVKIADKTDTRRTIIWVLQQRTCTRVALGSLGVSLFMLLNIQIMFFIVYVECQDIISFLGNS